MAITTQNSISGSDIIKKMTWIVGELKRSVINHNKENLQIQKEYFSRSVWRLWVKFWLLVRGQLTIWPSIMIVTYSQKWVSVLVNDERSKSLKCWYIRWPTYLWHIPITFNIANIWLSLWTNWLTLEVLIISYNTKRFVKFYQVQS